MLTSVGLYVQHCASLVGVKVNNMAMRLDQQKDGFVFT